MESSTSAVFPLTTSEISSSSAAVLGDGLKNELLLTPAAMVFACMPVRDSSSFLATDSPVTSPRNFVVSNLEVEGEISSQQIANPTSSSVAGNMFDHCPHSTTTPALKMVCPETVSNNIASHSTIAYNIIDCPNNIASNVLSNLGDTSKILANKRPSTVKGTKRSSPRFSTTAKSKKSNVGKPTSKFTALSRNSNDISPVSIETANVASDNIIVSTVSTTSIPGNVVMSSFAPAVSFSAAVQTMASHEARAGFSKASPSTATVINAAAAANVTSSWASFGSPVAAIQTAPFPTTAYAGDLPSNPTAGFSKAIGTSFDRTTTAVFAANSLVRNSGPVMAFCAKNSAAKDPEHDTKDTRVFNGTYDNMFAASLGSNAVAKGSVSTAAEISPAQPLSNLVGLPQLAISNNDNHVLSIANDNAIAATSAMKSTFVAALENTPVTIHSAAAKEKGNNIFPVAKECNLDTSATIVLPATFPATSNARDIGSEIGYITADSNVKAKGPDHFVSNSAAGIFATVSKIAHGSTRNVVTSPEKPNTTATIKTVAAVSNVGNENFQNSFGFKNGISKSHPTVPKSPVLFGTVNIPASFSSSNPNIAYANDEDNILHLPASHFGTRKMNGFGPIGGPLKSPTIASSSYQKEYPPLQPPATKVPNIMGSPSQTPPPSTPAPNTYTPIPNTTTPPTQPWTAKLFKNTASTPTSLLPPLVVETSNTVDGKGVILNFNMDFLKAARESLASIACIAFFCGNAHTFKFTKEEAFKRWGSKGLTHFLYNKAGFYTLKFDSSSAMKNVRDLNSILISGRRMFLKPWMEAHKFKKNCLPAVPAFVRFEDIPDSFWNFEGLRGIASSVGRFIQFERNTSPRHIQQTATMLIDIAYGHRLPDFCLAPVLHDGDSCHHVKVRISYPGLPPSCDFCCAFGHSNSRCLNNPSKPPPPQQKNKGKNTVPSSTQEASTSSQQATNSESRISVDPKHIVMVPCEHCGLSTHGSSICPSSALSISEENAIALHSIEEDIQDIIVDGLEYDIADSSYFQIMKRRRDDILNLQTLGAVGYSNGQALVVYSPPNELVGAEYYCHPTDLANDDYSDHSGSDDLEDEPPHSSSPGSRFAVLASLSDDLDDDSDGLEDPAPSETDGMDEPPVRTIVLALPAFQQFIPAKPTRHSVVPPVAPPIPTKRALRSSTKSALPGNHNPSPPCQ